jgi:hypothetical protein
MVRVLQITVVSLEVVAIGLIVMVCMVAVLLA